MDKDSREALQVAKELTAKFIETRTVSPGNFAEIFPAVYGVVARAIAQSGQYGCAARADADASDDAEAREAAGKGAGRHSGERE